MNVQQSLDFLDQVVSKNRISILRRIMCARQKPPSARIIQFWDKEPPEQISRILENNQELCIRRGVEYVRYDQKSAAEFLNRHFDPRTLRAYEFSPHPAMKADLFRLAEIYYYGGWYVDADLALRADFYKMTGLKGSAVFFKWDETKRRNICNWLFGAQPKNEVILNALYKTRDSILSFSQNNETELVRRILTVSGPAMFTRSIADYLSRHPRQIGSYGIRTVVEAYMYVQNGPAFLGAPLEYKQTEKHWLKAAKR